MIKGKTTKFRLDGVTYDIGAPFSGLSKEEEARLVAEGVAEYAEAQVITPNTQQSSNHTDGKIVSNMNAKTAIAFVGAIDSIEELNKLGLEETEGKNRATVVMAISERIAKLEKPELEDPENHEDPLNLKLNPEDMIVR